LGTAGKFKPIKEIDKRNNGGAGSRKGNKN